MFSSIALIINASKFDKLLREVIVDFLGRAHGNDETKIADG